jgi:alkanesulfonate monooxygenase SsuD/methylene tetrahydromethanopterin reductase-like flavin-dependent oxidoreductase (luciferase family)
MRTGVLGDVGGAGGGASVEALVRLGDAGAQGYDTAWLTDESRGGVLSAALLLGAAGLCARDKAPGIGLCARAGDAIHPLRVAEDLAVLDILCAGRLEWAISPDDEDWESIQIVLHAWRGEPFRHEGPHHVIPLTTCHPSPMSDPHPAFWLAGDARIPDDIALERHGRIVGMSTACGAVRERQGGGDAEGGVPRALVRLLSIGAAHSAAQERARTRVEAMLDRPLRAGEEVTDYAIAGDPAACRDQVTWLREVHAPDLLVVVPPPADPSDGQRDFSDAVLHRL